jgi:CRP-like cAMP-binding protein
MKIDAAQLDMLGYLSALPMFNELSPAARHSLLPHCSLLRFTRDDMIFRKGEGCEELHVLVSGRIKLYVVSAAGQEKVVELVEPGHSFAEAAMLLESLYLLNARALTATLLLRIDKQAVMEQMAKNHRFSKQMLEKFAQRIQGLLRDVEGYALHSGVQRLIDYLLNNLTGEHPRTGVVSAYLPASKATIASRLSLTPEYFSRVLLELKIAGLIEIDKREIRILDVHQLATYGGHGSLTFMRPERE